MRPNNVISKDGKPGTPTQPERESNIVARQCSSLHMHDQFRSAKSFAYRQGPLWLGIVVTSRRKDKGNVFQIWRGVRGTEPGQIEGASWTPSSLRRTSRMWSERTSKKYKVPNQRSLKLSSTHAQPRGSDPNERRMAPDVRNPNLPFTSFLNFDF
ncbi:uncharacterized protein EI90DRAFT_3225337 [Cantharellus anzutake]|uniref:uncharacterized protein n=1 Tax=Cantharellus anzutake TaxID=1750568 RepID=UPI0019046321|nr:uncharacterized protein EI90DRAFT_3225337 [Cantharellus anzutake]KAF8327158.1 hypothetical protein EI90DRAFT_3225337 [Cantharellus anzutake]